MYILSLIFLSALFPDTLAHTDAINHAHHNVHLNGSNLSMLWLLPFMGILLSIALCPLIAPHYWHSNYGKISLFWAAIFFIAFTFNFGFDGSPQSENHFHKIKSRVRNKCRI